MHQRQIGAQDARPKPDDLELARLKREKLRLREEIEKLERDLPPGAGQLSLLGGDVVPFDRHADKNKKR